MSITWKIEVEELPSHVIPSTQILVLELDPRLPSLRIGPRNKTGGGPELWNRAVLRVPLPLPLPLDTELVARLKSGETTERLNEIHRGYRAEMLWSGDFIGHWSQEAMDAVDHLVRLILSPDQPRI